MKIIRASVENFKRIIVAEVTPAGDVVEVTGKNEQGKSSLLDAIEAALGGKRRQPAEPIRRGAEKARVVLDLDEITVERVWTASSDRLVVKTKDGLSFPRAQAKLDELVGGLAFDPLAFAAMPPAEQRETLLRVVGVDLADFDRRRQVAYDRRREIGRDLRAAEARRDAIPRASEGTPDAEVSLAELSAEQERLLGVQRQNDAARDGARAVRQEAEAAAYAVTNREREVERLRSELAAAEGKLLDLRDAAASVAEAARKAETKAAALVDPDLDPLRERMQNVEAVNAAVRRKAEREALTHEVERLQHGVDTLTDEIEAVDADKAATLAAAPLPVEGLAITDDGVSYQGLPLDQAATSRRIRLCTAIGAALNPKLRIALIRDGNDLDEEALAAFYLECSAQGLQAWVERINGIGDGAIVIEAGRVAGGAQ